MLWLLIRGRFLDAPWFEKVTVSYLHILIFSVIQFLQYELLLRECRNRSGRIQFVFFLF